MNYVNIAQNIVAGRGIVQSALGFNEARFEVNDQIPAPTTSQPPGFPLIIAIFSCLGFSTTTVALLIPVISYGLMFIIAYLLAWELYNEQVAILTILHLLFYYPLRATAICALSETTGIAFLLLSLFFLVRPHEISSVPITNYVLAGLFGSLAFATRYSLLPIFFLGIFLLVKPGNWSWSLQVVLPYIIGFSLPAGLILVRNLVLTGRIMGKQRNSSDLRLIDNLRDTSRAVIGSYLGETKSKTQTVILVTSLIALMGMLIAQHELFVTVNSVFIYERRWLLTLWSSGYLAFLIYLRTRFYFSSIRPRLITPASVTLIILWSALLIDTLKPQVEYIIYLALISGSLIIYREITAIAKAPIHDQTQLVNASERLRWVEKHTTNRDLIIGDDTVDLPFFFNRPYVLSFSRFPYTDYPEYHKIMDYVRKHTSEFEYVYIVIRKRDTSENTWLQFYGAFITDIVYGKTEKYPGITLLHSLSNGYVFEVQCQEKELSLSR